MKGGDNLAAPTVTRVDIQSGTDRTVYATWTWSKKHTKNYTCRWFYTTGDGIWYKGSETTETTRVNTWNAPDNAKRVKFKVKANAEKHSVKVGKKTQQQAYWTSRWSKEVIYDFSKRKPSQLSAPTMTQNEFDKDSWTVENNNIDVNWTGTSGEFEISMDDKDLFNITTVALDKNQHRLAYSIKLAYGHRYKVRVRGVNESEGAGDWSEYSANVLTRPNSPTSIIELRTLTSTSVRVSWNSCSNCTSYEIQYTTQKEYFDSNSSEVKNQTVELVSNAEITGLETGQEYFFRVRAVNSAGNSEWCSVGETSVILGRKPSPPTTWSSSTTVMNTEDVILYWVHNSEDGSSQTYAELELDLNGEKKTVTIQNTTDEFEKDKVSHYNLWDDNYRFLSSGTVKWRVRTRGITKEYSDWSVQRVINICSIPAFTLYIENDSGNWTEIVDKFPLRIRAAVRASEEVVPIGYSVTITSVDTYMMIDETGTEQIVGAGDVIYSKLIDIRDKLELNLSAGDINLENNQKYILRAIVALENGLSVETGYDFKVSWSENENYEPNADIGFNENDYSVQIKPYCVDENDNLVEGVLLSVYRRNFDGEFIEIASGINNMEAPYVTDPHPNLDYARYRIVAIEEKTGSVSYYDMPGFPISEPAIIIQWNDRWSNFNSSIVNEEDEPEVPIMTSSFLRLPYNIDLSYKTAPDVSFVSYVGRKNPVSYYGTQIGETASWKVDIPADDKETLYQLRKLSKWMGDVYVREPSGSGYWANISVSFTQTHNSVVIPVTLEITRVEGGV